VQTVRLLVLGAGVVGVCTAWSLRSAGHDLIAVERQPASAMETSFANGGQISASRAEPWANPAAPARILRWLGRADAPLLYRPRAELQQWLFGRRGAKAKGRRSAPALSAETATATAPTSQAKRLPAR
jgi:D-amino-acid dehydrogenase